MNLADHKVIKGLALSSLKPAVWNELAPLPNLTSDPVFEYFKFGYGLREFHDGELRALDIYSHDPTYHYNVAMRVSENPVEDRFFRQARIWWNNGVSPDSEQPIHLGEFLWQFKEDETKWFHQQGSMEEKMEKLYGCHMIYTTLWLSFGIMKESGVKMFGDQGPWAYTEYRIWSYPYLTSD